MDEQFYKLRVGYATQYYFADVDVDGIPDESFTNGMRGFRGTVPVRVIKGGRPGDFLGNNAGLCIVSEKVLNVLLEHKFERYETYTVEVSGGRGDLPKYHGLAFLGRGGYMLPEESGVKYATDEDGIKYMIGMKRLVFDVSEWDGSDLFYLADVPGARLVTERVKTAFKKHKITNYELTPLEEVCF